MNDKAELLPCPFCGGANIDPAMARGFKGGDKSKPIVAAGCWECGAIGPMVPVESSPTGYVDAAAAWNTRT